MSRMSLELPTWTHFLFQDLSDQESVDDPTAKMGGLSLDENHEVNGTITLLLLILAY